MHNQNQAIKNMVLSALMLAIAYILPNFTGNIPQIGAMLLPMHLPTILCGFLCGGLWGAAVGFAAPLMRSLILTMPPMFALVSAMLCGRVVWGVVTALLLLNGEGFTFAAFIAGAFTNAVPGIILQLAAIPAVVLTLQKTKLVSQPA